MAKVSAGDIRNGVTIEVDGKVCQVIDFMHVKPGKGAAFVRVKMKNIIDGGVVETTFRPTETFEQAHIERKKMQYLYNDGEFYNYMDNETFEQIKKQLNRLVEVIKVIDFTDVFVRMKEILYVKVRKCTKDDKVECFQIAETFKAKVIDYGKDSVLMEFVQTGTKNDAVIKLMKEEFESIEVVRGGSVGIESISMMER
jgi:acetolactate synthase small subunit